MTKDLRPLTVTTQPHALFSILCVFAPLWLALKTRHEDTKRRRIAKANSLIDHCRARLRGYPWPRFAFAALALFVCLSALPQTGRTDDERAKPIHCLVCEKTHSTSQHTAEYKGMRIPLCSSDCMTEFERRRLAGTLDSITSKIEPRTALFQEDSNPKVGLSKLYFLVGLYVLLGLICGGVAAFVAVQKGLPGGSAFALALAFNILGLVFVMTRPAREMPFTSRGLDKIPSTRDGIICPQCGRANHPSAQACIACRAKLSPLIPSEVQLAGLRREG